MSHSDQQSTAGSHGPREERKGARTIAGRLLAAASLFLLSGGCVLGFPGSSNGTRCAGSLRSGPVARAELAWPSAWVRALPGGRD